MKNICMKVIGILLIVTLLVLHINISFAVTEQDINNQKDQQNEIENQIDEAEQKYEELESEKSETLKQVESLGSQIDAYEAQIDELDSKIDEANAQIEEAEAKLAEEQEKYEHQKEMLEKRIVAMYEAGETTYLDVLLSSETITDFISYYYIVSEIAECDLELLESIQKQKEEIELAKQQIEQSKQELTEAKAEKQSVTVQLKSAKTEKEEYTAQLTEQEKELEAEIQELKEANDKIQEEIKEAEKKYAEQLEALKKQQEEEAKNNSSSSSSSSSSTGTGYLTAPVSGTISATAYYSSGKFHGAIDYAVSVGTPVYAAADGVVMSTANLTTSYGTYIVIRHANGLQTYYAHGTYGSICVSPGDIVTQGQKIMLSGNTGNSSGPHLHFEVRISPYSYSAYATAYGQDSRVNPLLYM